MSTSPLALAQKRAAAAPPNVLLIIADDVAAWMLGCYGNKEFRTPNIDLLARGGLRFSAGFACTPASSPSRATLFTGRTPMQHGVQDFLTDRPIDNPPQGQFAPPPSFASEVMIPDVLAGQGYRCGYTGKWHMGEDQKPQHRFDYWYTMLGGEAENQNPRMSLNGQIVEEKGYLADRITEHATRFLDGQKADQPFFLAVSYANAHAPYDGHPQKYYDLYAKTKFETVGFENPAATALRGKEYLKDVVGSLRKVAAAVTAMDDRIPALIKKLEERQLRDNTLVVFVGGNGSLLGRHGLWDSGLASDPINMYDEAVQVPMIFNWPGRTPVQASRPDLIGMYDIMPTICDAAGAAAPEGKNLCGRSFLPILTGRAMPKKQPWATVVFGAYRNTVMARDNRYKLVIRNDGKGPNELFDFRADPREKVNQYDNPRFVTVRDRLMKDLTNWRRKYSS